MVWLDEVLKDRKVSFEESFSVATIKELSTSLSVGMSKCSMSVKKTYSKKVENRESKAFKISYEFTPGCTRQMHIGVLCQLEYYRGIESLVTDRRSRRNFETTFFQEGNMTIEPLTNDHIFLLSENKIDCNQVIPLGPDAEFYNLVETSLNSIDSSCKMDRVTFTLNQVPSIPCHYANILSFIIYLAFVLRDPNNVIGNLVKPECLKRLSQLMVDFSNIHGEVNVDELVDIGVSEKEIFQLKTVHAKHKQMFIKDLLSRIPKVDLTDVEYGLACKIFDTVMQIAWQNKLSSQ